MILKQVKFEFIIYSHSLTKIFLEYNVTIKVLGVKYY